MILSSYLSPPNSMFAVLIMSLLFNPELGLLLKKIGEYLLAGLHELQERHERIGDVREHDLLAGIKLVEHRASRQSADALGVAVGDTFLQRGLSMKIVCSTGGMLNCFRMAPPLSITESGIDTTLTIIDDRNKSVRTKAADQH